MVWTVFPMAPRRMRGGVFADFSKIEDILGLSAKILALPPTVWKVYNGNTTVGGGVCG